MAKDIVMRKSPEGGLVPTDSVGVEYLQNIAVGKMLGVTITQARNYEFHKKLFALLGYMYDVLPRAQADHNGEPVVQSFKTFRREMVAYAGFYEIEATRRGTLRKEPQSLSYSECSEELAQAIYSAMIDKALHLLGEDQSREDLDEIVNEIMRFD